MKKILRHRNIFIGNESTYNNKTKIHTIQIGKRWLCAKWNFCCALSFHFLFFPPPHTHSTLHFTEFISNFAYIHIKAGKTLIGFSGTRDYTATYQVDSQFFTWRFNICSADTFPIPTQKKVVVTPANSTSMKNIKKVYVYRAKRKKNGTELDCRRDYEREKRPPRIVIALRSEYEMMSITRGSNFPYYTAWSEIE